MRCQQPSRSRQEMSKDADFGSVHGPQAWRARFLVRERRKLPAKEGELRWQSRGELGRENIHKSSEGLRSVWSDFCSFILRSDPGRSVVSKDPVNVMTHQYFSAVIGGSHRDPLCLPLSRHWRREGAGWAVCRTCETKRAARSPVRVVHLLVDNVATH